MDIDKEWSNRALNTKRWESLREKILRRDGYLDQVERRFGKNVTANTVHHIFPREFFPELTFTPWNLISVSSATHNRLHDRETNQLTHEGWELLKRTARLQKITISEELRAAIVCEKPRPKRPPRG